MCSPNFWHCRHVFPINLNLIIALMTTSLLISPIVICNTNHEFVFAFYHSKRIIVSTRYEIGILSRLKPQLVLVMIINNHKYFSNVIKMDQVVYHQYKQVLENGTVSHKRIRSHHPT